MKRIRRLLIIALVLSVFSCEKVSEHAVELSVDFTWEGLTPCEWGNPRIEISGVPKQTKFIKLHMYDNEYHWDHGEVTYSYVGSGVIEMGTFKEIQEPCPGSTPGSYEITIKALDENKVIVGTGRRERLYPE